LKVGELLLLLLLKTKEEFEAMEGGAFSLGQLNLAGKASGKSMKLGPRKPKKSKLDLR
jgi:hypothetical protein